MGCKKTGFTAKKNKNLPREKMRYKEKFTIKYLRKFRIDRKICVKKAKGVILRVEGFGRRLSL